MRIWLHPLMAADTGGTPGASADPPDPSAETKTTDTGAATEHMIPKSRFDEVNGELQRLRAAQQKQEQAARTEAERQAAARGEFEKLATDRAARVAQLEAEQAATDERLSAYEAEMERQIGARLKRLPDEIRAMAPESDTLARFAWLDKAEAAAQKLTATRTPGTPSGPRGAGAAALPQGGDPVATKRASGDYAL